MNKPENVVEPRQRIRRREAAEIISQEAIDRWRISRFPHLFPLTKSDDAEQSRELARARIDSM